MNSVPNISPAEWEVMKVIWEKSPISSPEVVEKLSSQKWSPYTVKVMLNHLLKKGALTFQAEGNRYFYLPKISKEECMRYESQTFLQKIFDGAAASMLVHLVQNVKLSPSERKYLKRVLEGEETSEQSKKDKK